MKKLIAMFVVIVMLAGMMAGCNVGLGPGNFNFKKVHVDTHGYSGCFTVEKWYDNETGIEVKTKEAGTMYLSEGTYVLLGGDKPCPFCKGDK